jgi:hypothetical protein
VQPVVQRSPSLEDVHRQQLDQFLLQLPSPEETPVRSLEIPDGVLAVAENEHGGAGWRHDW